MDLFLFSMVLLLLLLYFMFVPYMRMRREMLSLPPGPTPLPLIGSLWKMNPYNVVKSMTEMNKTYGDIFTIYRGHTPYVILCGYQAIKETLIEKSEEFSGRGPHPVFSRFTKGDDIGLSNGEKWRQLRGFTIATLRNFGMGKRTIEERIKEEAMFLVKDIKEKKGIPIDPTYCVSRSVSNIICSVVFGRRFDYSDPKLQKLVQCVQENFKIISTPWGDLCNIYPDIMEYIPGPHRNITYNFQTIANFITEMMEDHKRTLDIDCPRDYIDCFLAKIRKEETNFNSYFSPRSLVMSTLILFFAGTETVGTTLRYCFLLLMKYPKIAEKVYREIDDVVGHNRSPNYEDRTKMPYTNAFLHEVQRYGDVVPFPSPRQLTMDTHVRDYKFRKGTIFMPFLTTVHFDKTRFTNPENFEPGNFLDENGRFMKNEAFIAFSAGKRICPGETLAVMELFLYFTIILQNFTIKSLVPPEEISITPIGVSFGRIPPTYQCCLIAR
ncbi:cytochrome P450 2F2-like [Discoglossus pictus]